MSEIPGQSVVLLHQPQRDGGDAVKLNKTSMLASCVIGASLILGCSLLIPPEARGAQQECSVGKLQGRYVFSGQGSNLHYGAFDFDGAGKFLGKQTSLRHTIVQRENLNGTYTLAGDCTGTMTSKVSRAILRTGTFL
jgi:hypothetical protein